MKATLKKLVLCACFLFLLPNTSQAFLTNWYLDLDGANGGTNNAFLVSELLDTVGTAWILNDVSGPSSPTFQEWGTFNSSGIDGTFWNTVWAIDGSTKFTGELTAIFNATGSLDLLERKAYFTGGNLEVYVDPTPNYNSSASMNDGIYYGANDGTLIATFSLTGGVGIVDTDSLAPNGMQTTFWESTWLATNYWYDSDWNDLSSTTPINWVLGYGTTNAAWSGNFDNDNARDEIYYEYANNPLGLEHDAWPTNDGQTGIWFSGNGQFKLNVVPEPTTMLLLGVGLIGLAGLGRKKFFKKD